MTLSYTSSAASVRVRPLPQPALPIASPAEKIWDTVKGELLHSLERHRDAVTMFSVSEDCKYLVSAGQDGDVHFWDVDEGEHINTYEGTGRIIHCQWNSKGDKVWGNILENY